MTALEQRRNIHWQRTHIIAPGSIGCIMLGASFLPWLHDPLGGQYTAWQLPVNIGWQLQSTGYVSYGLLCAGCVLYAFLIAYIRWQSQFFDAHMRWLNRLSYSTFPLGICCFFPVLLFLEQYLITDLYSIETLTQHTVQFLLIQHHMGYGGTKQLIPLQAFAVSSASLEGRLEILVNQASGGILVPAISALIALDYTRFFALPISLTTTKTQQSTDVSSSKSEWHKLLLAVAGSLFLLTLLGRAPLAMIFEYQAKNALALGNYTLALQRLDEARNLNPALDQFPAYHQERGQAWYFLYPGNANDDTHIYLSSVYREQEDYRDAYQELQATWQAQIQNPPSWLIDEMSTTLELIAETTHKTPGSLAQKMGLNSNVLPWLQLLTRVDDANAYSRYVAARIYYGQYNYDACIEQMNATLRLSRDLDVQSSAYTYIALSMAREGNTAAERDLLFRAVELDSDYHNNTAREALSGLH